MSRELAGTKRNEQSKTAGRRNFLRLAGLGAAGASAAAVTGASAAAAEAPLPETAAGYRESGHVKKVYELARF